MFNILWHKTREQLKLGDALLCNTEARGAAGGGGGRGPHGGLCANEVDIHYAYRILSWLIRLPLGEIILHKKTTEWEWGSIWRSGDLWILNTLREQVLLCFLSITMSGGFHTYLREVRSEFLKFQLLLLFAYLITSGLRQEHWFILIYTGCWSWL